MLVFRSSVWLLQPIDPLSHLGDYLPWWRSNVYVRICADICTFLCHRQFIHMMFVLSPRFDHRGDILRRDCAGGLFRVRQGVRRPLPSRCWERVDWFAAYPCTRRERKLWSCELIFRFTTFTLLLFHHSTRPLPASSTPGLDSCLICLPVFVWVQALFLLSYILAVLWTLLPISMGVLINSFFLIAGKVVISLFNCRAVHFW